MLLDGILDSYERYGGVNSAEGADGGRLPLFPNRQLVVRTLGDLESLIFPGFKEEAEVTGANLRYVTGARVNSIIGSLTREVQKAFVYTVAEGGGEHSNIQKSHCFHLAEDVCFALIEEIPNIRRMALMDARALLEGDPAAGSVGEVILSYPGLEAILCYRIAHFLAKNGVPVIPRIMSEHTHGKTGIDINPKAAIGERFFIDHGTGVVIGETCVIGQGVKIYQGVTLGALSVRKEMTGKRHPTIEDDVTIYAGATILGGDTVIGRGATIGGNTWITKSVPPGSVVTR